MSGEAILRAEQVSKKFCRSLKRGMLYAAADIGRRSLGLSPPVKTLRPAEFWALERVSCELRPGECLGVIGLNGAGKSTLLKLLAGILQPDEGKIEVRGSVGALIEVGAGFHPMLTGRENLWVNGAIMGMQREEIARKFDAIVEFAQLRDWMETPVKFYSSGMHVRLGFSIAAHLEPDVLLVDEVLAVGDASFRRRCQERMTELMARGMAIILVSHDMDLVQHLCPRVLLLERGQAPLCGSFAQVYPRYLERILPTDTGQANVVLAAAQDAPRAARQTGELDFTDISITAKTVTEVTSSAHQGQTFTTGDRLELTISYLATRLITRPIFQVAAHREDGTLCFAERTSNSHIAVPSLQTGPGQVRVVIPCLNLKPGVYRFELLVADELAVMPYGRRWTPPFRVVSSHSVSTDPRWQAVYTQPVEWSFDEASKP